MPATTWWSVLVEFAPTGEGRLATQDDRFDLFADAVEEHDGVVGGGGGSYSVRLSVLGEDAAVAALHGRDLAWKAARRSDLPEWPCVRLEAIAHDSLAAELEVERLPQLVGSAEVTKILNVSRQRVAELRSAKVDFPRPVAELAAGPVWMRPAIELWKAGWDRSPGRRKATADVQSSSTSTRQTLKVGHRGGASRMEPSNSGKSYRSARTGRFVTKAVAKRTPDTAVGEGPGKKTAGKKK